MQLLLHFGNKEDYILIFLLLLLLLPMPCLRRRHQPVCLLTSFGPRGGRATGQKRETCVQYIFSSIVKKQV
jgi:hypothetical protein